MKRAYLIFLILTLPVTGITQTEVPFTLEDRDRLILVESQLQSLRMETRFVAVNDKFVSMESKFENRFATIEKMLQKNMPVLHRRNILRL